MMVNLVLGVILAVITIGLPGLLLARRLARPEGLLETVTASLGLGALLVSFAGYSAGMLTQVFATRGIYVLVAIVIVVLLRGELVSFLRECTPAGARALGRILWRRRGAITFLALVTAYVGLAFDDEQIKLTCVNYRVARGLGFGMTDGAPWTSNQLLSMRWGGRGGAAMEISLFPAVFGFIGFRLSYLCHQMIILLSVAVAARRLGVRLPVALLSGAVLALGAPVGQVVEVDPNLIALAAGALLLALAIGRRASPLLLGMLFGIVFNVEHIMLPAGAALLWWLWSDPDRRPRDLGALAAGAALVASVELIYHQVAYGSFLYYEGLDIWANFWPDREPVRFPHRFLWWDFELETQLNFPYSDRIVRSPYNPLPTFLLFPIHFLAGYGALFSAVTAVGALRMWRQHRAVLIFIALYALPYFTILQFQENWSDSLKLRLGLMFTAGPALCFASGLEGVLALRARPRWAMATAAVAAGLFLAWGSIVRLDFPADERLYLGSPSLKRESPADLQAVRASYLPPRWLPRPGRPPHLSGSVAAVRHQVAHPHFRDQPRPLAELMEQIVAKSWYDRVFNPIFDHDAAGHALGWRPRPPPRDIRYDALDWPDTVILDLAEPLVGSHDWLRGADPGDASVDSLERLEIPDAGEVTRIEGLGVPWVDGPVDLALAHVSYGGQPVMLLLVLHRDPEEYDVPLRRLPEDRLVLELEDGIVLSPVQVIYYMPAVSFGWEVDVVDGEIELGAAVKD